MINNFILSNSKEKKEYMNFGLCSLGFFISLFGSSIYTFAIGLYVLKITGSGLSFATALVLGSIPMIIINPFAGVLADKLDKKKIVVIMDLLNGILFLTIFFLSHNNGLRLYMIYVSTFIMTIFTTLFNISFEAAIPNIVSDRCLMRLNSTSKIINSTSEIFGPMLGGLVFSFVDIRLFVLINGISFIISGITEMLIDFKYNIRTDEKNESKEKWSFINDIKEGFIYLNRSKEVVELITIFLTLNIATSFCISIPLPYIINNVLSLSAKYYGIIQGSFSVGVILGALGISKFYKRVKYKKLLFFMSTLMSLLIITIGLPIVWMESFTNVQYLIYYCFIMTLVGVAISFIDIPAFYILQTIIPDEFRGRVLSIILSIVKSLVPIALISSGVLINKVVPFYIPIGGGMIFLVFNIFFYK